jgi:IS30 family transposase
LSPQDGIPSSHTEKCPTKATNIPDRTSIHDRPKEADVRRFGDWEMDLIIGNGYNYRQWLEKCHPDHL